MYILLMIWIDKNLHIKPINTHIDPYRPVENAIITHAHADHAKPGHKNVLATKETIEIMKIRYGENCASNFQELNLNQKIEIGNVSITFYPAGHILGSVQVLAEFKGHKINFTGDYKTTRPLDATAKPVKCHTLVTEATFGLPVFQHPDEKKEIQKLIKSLSLFPERPHLVGVYALGKAQRVINLLRLEGYDKNIFIHGSLEKLCDYYDKNHIKLGDLTKVNLSNKNQYNGQIILAPPSAIKNVWARKFEDPIICQASGWMAIKQRAKQSLVELPLILSDHADWSELTKYIKFTNAEKIYVTHGREEAIIHWCRINNIDATPLSLSGRDDEEQ